MNVGGMSAENPSWTLFCSVAFPGSVGCVLLLWLFKWLWDERPGSPLGNVKGGIQPYNINMIDSDESFWSKVHEKTPWSKPKGEEEKV
jgi:hypothetical protein